MSLAVLKRKLDNKERHRKINSESGGYKIAVTNTGSNKSQCATSYDKKLIAQQSYRNLYRSRIQKFVEPRTNYKRMPESSTKQYIENVKSNAINDNIEALLNTTAITNTSNVNIINSDGNKYVFNNSQTYNSNEKWTLTDGTYILKNVPSMHPIAILNKKTSNISYSLVNNSPIIIKVSGGDTVQTNGDYYTFTDVNDNPINIGNGSFKFMRGQTYKFQANNIDVNHPFKIFMNGSFVNNNGITGTTDSIIVTIPTNHSTTLGSLYYQCGVHSNMNKNLSLLYKLVTGTTADGSYDFYYGDVAINISGNFDKVSIYCFYHGYMGGENLFVYTEPENTPKMLTAGDQIARVKARRVCKNRSGSCNNYEMEISGNSASKSVCP
jgi:hypothetical protein